MTHLRLLRGFISLSLALVCSGCEEGSSNSDEKDSGGGTAQERTFRMGFTPWPYAATLAAQDDIYSFIEDNADLIAIHLDGGIPWPEAATADNFDNYGTGVKNEINGVISRLGQLSNKQIYLAISPFNGGRDDVALYWNSSTNEALPSPWDTYDFAEANLISAYVNYVDQVIKKIGPTYVNYAIEINEYYHNVSAERSNLQTFYTSVYTQLKAKHPTVVFMTSFAMSSPGSTKMSETADLFVHHKDYLDRVGISIYPYAFFSHSDKGDPANLPGNWLSQIETIAPGQTYFVTETGFIGESLSIPAYSLDVNTNQQKQRDYLTELFEECNELEIEGIVWFSAYDFDDLWSDLLNDNLSLIWRDTGLKDGNQNDRLSLQEWQEWFESSLVEE